MNWKRFLRREAADAEQQEELEFYVEVTAEEYVERGMQPEAARAAARRKLGNMTLVREEIYRMNTITFAENALRTARHTVRLVRTQPGFVLTVVLSLALGIGANTAIFSVVHDRLNRSMSRSNSPMRFQLAKIRVPLCASGRMGPNVEQTPRGPRLQLVATSSVTLSGRTACKVR